MKKIYGLLAIGLLAIGLLASVGWAGLLGSGVQGISNSSSSGSSGGSGTPGGSNTQVQFNDAGSFGADSGLVYSSGNVGIGSTSPAAKLNIVDTNSTADVSRRVSQTTLTDSGATTNTTTQTRIVNYSSGVFTGDFTSEGSSLVLGSNELFISYSGTINSNGDSNDLFLFGQRVTPTFTGTVADAADSLAIYSFTTANTSDAGTTGGVAKYGYHAIVAGTADSNIGFYSYVSGATSNYNFYAVGSAPNYFGGNVGIGEPAPSSLLEVASGGVPYLQIDPVAQSYVMGDVSGAGGSTYLSIDDSAGTIQQFSGGFTPITVSGGFVGVNNNNPAEAFSVWTASAVPEAVAFFNDDESVQFGDLNCGGSCTQLEVNQQNSQVSVLALNGLSLSQGSGNLSLVAPNLASDNLSFTLPSSSGTAGQFLMTSGTGTLSWADAGSSFTPDSIGDLSLWLDANLGTFQDSGCSTPATANNDPVGCWQDQSGNGVNFTTSTAGVRPLLKTNVSNSLPGIAFDGTNDYLTAGSTPLNTLDDVSIVLVGFFSADTGEPFSKYAGSAGFLIGSKITSSDMEAGGTGYNLISCPSANFPAQHIAGEPKIFVVTRSTEASNQSGFINGIPLSSMSSGGAGGTGTINSAGADLNIGARSGLASGYFTGTLRAILVYSRKLTVNDMKNLQEYYSTRFAI